MGNKDKHFMTQNMGSEIACPGVDTEAKYERWNEKLDKRNVRIHYGWSYINNRMYDYTVLKSLGLPETEDTDILEPGSFSESM